MQANLTEHVSAESSLDEKLGHTTLNLFAVSGLQLDLVEVNAYVCTIKTFVGRRQCLIILHCLCFPFVSFLKKQTDPTLPVFSFKSPGLHYLSEPRDQSEGGPQCPNFL